MNRNAEGASGAPMADLDRIKRDLETIHAAAGFGQPPLGREDVRALDMLGLMGLAGILWPLAFGPLSPGGITIYLFACSVAGVGFYQFSYMRSPKRTAARDRSNRWSWGMALLLSFLIDGFCIWAKFYGGLQKSAFLGSALILSGALTAVLAFTDYWRRCFWGWSVPLLLLGVVVQLIPEGWLATAVFALVCVGGFTSAAILSSQLKAAAKVSSP